MSPNYSKLLTRSNTLAAASTATVATALTLIWYLKKKRKNVKSTIGRNIEEEEEEVKYLINDKRKHVPKAHVDILFFKRVFPLIKIAIPSWTSPEIGFLLLIAGSLIARSLGDYWLISFETKIENSIISRNKKLFVQRLFTFVSAIPILSVINNALKFTTGELKLRLRSNMTRRLLNEYLKNRTYYRMSNLDNRLANPDQLLTADVEKFSDTLAELYCNTTKPLLDVIIYLYRLSFTLGGVAPIVMLLYIFATGAFLMKLRQPSGKMTALEQKLEGEYRNINARLITYSEEIAFYSGHDREKITILASFNKLFRNLKKFLRLKAFMTFIDDMVSHHFPYVSGFWILSLVFFSNSHEFTKFDMTERSRLYYTSGRMLIKFAAAVGRLLLAGRDLAHLAGLTTRVAHLREIITDVNAGKYERTMAVDLKRLMPNTGGIIFKDNVIKFDRVPLVTPNGDILIEELSFEVKSGMNVLVYGPNGSGKSSLFRILGELWPLFGGELTKPPYGKLFYVPQKPYMTLGSLRDQITYPHTGLEAKRKGITDKTLQKYLELVQLSYLIKREGGLDAVADWLDILSGGEKQRIAMARLFYHVPQFAILDECTSAVSVDIEGSMYKYCRDVGITLFTVSHRKSLWQHHEYVLHLDGIGGYTFKSIDSSSKEMCS